MPCSVNATTDCSYTWINNKSEEIASGSNLFLQKNKIGRYICKADCVFRKKHRCLLDPVKVNYNCDRQGKWIVLVAIIENLIHVLMFITLKKSFQYCCLKCVRIIY